MHIDPEDLLIALGAALVLVAPWGIGMGWIIYHLGSWVMS